jgi:hypothetical protein
MNHRWLRTLAVVLLLGCSHGEPFASPDVPSDALGPGDDVRLTYNVEQDYWPAWTADGRGILYSFVNLQPGTQHRCIGLIPATGGTRTWQLCDDRGIERDSVNSFTAYALDANGRLLYTEATAADDGQTLSPDRTTLWIADTSMPFVRRALLTLPAFANTTPIEWLVDLEWTGPSTFLALDQDLAIYSHCRFCGFVDSAFYGIAVLRGTIDQAGVTFVPIEGTTGATSYSLAENGTSIVFTLRNDRRLYKVPAAGGTRTLVTAPMGQAGGQLLGVSCRGSNCVVASDPVTLSDDVFGTFPSADPGTRELHAVSLVTGAVLSLRKDTTGIFATPRVSPVNGDVVLQVGGAFGHIQTFTNSGSDLHLYSRLVP